MVKDETILQLWYTVIYITKAEKSEKMALLFLSFFKIFFCPFLSTFQRYMIEKSINGGSMKRIKQPLEAWQGKQYLKLDPV
uniref:Uncharacterized protein n=1 Tax=Tetranychus urticae TaxID=32264 RepID=T1JZC9_TETUR